MHDLEMGQFEYGQQGVFLENSADGSSEIFTFGENTLSEVDEMEMASELLEITDEMEIDQFLGKMFKKAGRFLRSPAGRALGGMLKGVIKKALPMATGALGTMIPIPGLGTVLGSAVGSAAGRMLGLEMEGLSEEDQEMEVARRLVRLTADAAQKLSAIPAQTPPQQAAQAALIKAAKIHAPGLISGGIKPVTVADAIGGRSGRWVRRGSRIVLYGI